MIRGLCRLAIVLVLTAAGAVAVPGAAAAGIPEYQRVIKARSANATLVHVDGCIRTVIFMSSGDYVFGGRPGPVNKQGLTAVLVDRFDTCATGGTAPVRPAAEPSGTLIFTGTGDTLDPLQSTPRFDRAWIEATVPVLDEVSGRTVPVRLDLQWSLTGALTRENGHSHARFPLGGIVNSHTQTLSGDALVSGSVAIASAVLTVEPTEAYLEQVKYGCQVVFHPRGDAALSC